MTSKKQILEKKCLDAVKKKWPQHTPTHVSFVNRYVETVAVHLSTNSDGSAFRQKIFVPVRELLV